MVIQSSHAQMYAKTGKQYSYRQTKETAMRNVMTGKVRYEQNEFSLFYGESAEEMQDEEKAGRKTAPLSAGNVENTQDAQITRLEDALTQYIRRLREYLQNMRNRLLTNLFTRSPYRDGGFLTLDSPYAIDASSGLGSVSIWNRVEHSTYSYTESESMSFETTGTVVTADGRQIEFNMELSMSREFTETVECLKQDNVMAIMTDPLVISLDANPVTISDQKWEFDIDADGETDSISLLGKGAGFLAYDKNGDGIINDGLELFGSKTGNGFAELSAYDEDGNGWIDEKDSIYEKLSVWTKDDTGNDAMLSLKQANVGAIYLGNRKTDYSMNSVQTNEKNAMLRRTGMYLTETGVANTIQQFDMVKALIS